MLSNHNTLAAGTSPDLSERAYNYGSKCGEAFQIADDLKEIINITKTRNVDINKIVTLVSACLYFTNESTSEILDPILRKEIDMIDCFETCSSCAISI